MALTISGTDGITFPNEQTLVTAWVHFNGTGTVAIQDDGNVSSLNDYGTGQYATNFSNSFANAYYCANGFVGSTTTSIGIRVTACENPSYQRTTARVGTSHTAGNNGTTYQDVPYCSVSAIS